MIARMLAAALLMLAATSVAPAQRQWQRAQKLPFPAEKFSTRPVQANPSSHVDPTETTQKQRWHERSRNPSVEPR
jgi:hypothetical protein